MSTAIDLAMVCLSERNLQKQQVSDRLNLPKPPQS